MSELPITRRRALTAYWSFVAASRLSRAQVRTPPVDELVNAGEFEAAAERKLDSLTFAEVRGSERTALDRITLRPRLMIDSREMDLTTELFGQSMFMPILVGPVSQLKRYHPEGELAMARGASAAKAVLVVAGKSSYPIEQIAAQAKTPLWYQLDLSADWNEMRSSTDRAMACGCKALCVTISTGVDWSVLERLRKSIRMPLVLKGIMSADEAARALSAGAQGLVVSNYAPKRITGVASSIEVLPAVVEAVAGKVAVLMDGSVRRGSDVLKALALGARAVLVARPSVWGLAAYGADGVQSIVEVIQSEFARDMAMCGKVSVSALDRTVVRIHRR